jgi:hypothetical protein
VRDADLHCRPAALALPLHGGRHHESPERAKRPEPAAVVVAKVAAPAGLHPRDPVRPNGCAAVRSMANRPAAGRRDTRLGHAHASGRVGVVGYELESVPQGVPATAAAEELAPVLELISSVLTQRSRRTP